MKSLVYDRQIFFMCLISVLGFGIFSTANTAAASLSTGAWLAVLTDSCLFAVSTAVFCRLAKRHEGDTLYDYSPKAAGTVGKVFSAVFALFYLSFAGLAVSYFSHIVSMWILPNTSFRLIAAFIVLICAAALLQSFTSTIRLTGFLGVITVITVIVIRLVMVFCGDTSNLLPIAEHDVLQSGFIHGAISCATFFFGTGILAIIPQSSLNKHSIRAGILGVLCAGAVLILVCEACISMLGPVQTGMYPDAMAVSMKAFDISRVTFIQRADIIFIITWTLLILPAACCICYIPYVYIRKKLPESKGSPIATTVVCALVFIIANTAKSMADALSYISLLCRTAGVAAVFIIPAILLILSEVRKHEKN